MSKIRFHELDFIKKHIELYKRDPARAHCWDSSPGGGPGVLPTLLLTTRGRKTGELRDVPLIYGAYPGRDDTYVIVASRGGTPTHPVWFLNLEADPACEIQVGPEHLLVRARVAEGDERARLWTQMSGIYPPYDDYQKNASARTIPVVVLEPR